MKSIDEKKKFLQEILEIIHHYSDSIEQDNYLKEAALISDTPVRILYEMFQKRNTTQKSTLKSELPNNFSPEDILLSYIFEDASYIDSIRELLIFPEALSLDMSRALSDPHHFFTSLNLARKEQYKALSFQNSEASLTSEEHLQKIQKLCEQINRACYKELSESYKSQMKL